MALDQSICCSILPLQPLLLHEDGKHLPQHRCEPVVILAFKIILTNLTYSADKNNKSNDDNSAISTPRLVLTAFQVFTTQYIVNITTLPQRALATN